MSEIITTYRLDDLAQPIPMGREEFYEDQIAVFKKTGKPTRAAAIADVLLFDSDKQIILQERSKFKKHNPGMTDKTMGGHITFGDTADYTVMLETLQELNIPSFVLNNEEDFKKTYKLLNKFTQNTCIVQLVDTRTVNLKKIFGKEVVPIANKYYLYLGIYNGAYKPSDKEAAGIKFFNYNTLLDDIKVEPEKYTDDLKFFTTKYSNEIKRFLKNI